MRKKNREISDKRIKIGVIADDFTGATDAASFIVKGGLTAVQYSGVPSDAMGVESDALVISLKSRSCAAEEAISQSLQACEWLLAQGCNLIYFKYCSTFDSTEKGNIGPVTDALMERLKVNTILICPALPVNGRTVYQGNLFVFDQLLAESGMKNHPITPMRDSNLLRLMESQAAGKAGLLDWHQIALGTESAQQKISHLSVDGHQYIVCDAISDQNLTVIAQCAQHHQLVTGGSGLIGAIATQATSSAASASPQHSLNQGGKGVVLSGSCSLMTNKQVSIYMTKAAHFKLDAVECINNPQYVEYVERWVLAHSDGDLFPMVYATVDASELKSIQASYGELASTAVETVFNQLVKRLYAQGMNNFISAGGETSGTVTHALSVHSFRVGEEIAPGVPWMTSLDGEVQVALKSGNFGDENFFVKAQEMLK